MKKVLFLIGSLQGGGAEKVLVDTVNSLDSEKYDITVQTLFDEGFHRSRLSDKVRYRTIIRCRSKLIRRILGKFLLSVVPARVTYNCFVKDGYDYEIAFLEGIPTKLISESTDKASKKIAWIHTELINNPASCYAYGSEEEERRAYQAFDKIICVAKSVEDAFLRKYGPVTPKVETLYNVLDDAAVIAASRGDAILPTNLRPCLISVGRMVWAKGYDRLLRIHKRLIDEGLEHALLIIGDGEMRPELQDYILQNGLQETAHLLGFQSNPYQYIRKADAFICSSYAEGFSTVVTESVLCGTPVITTDVSGAREPVDAPRCSVIVENDETALYMALRTILSKPTILDAYREVLTGSQGYFRKQNLLAQFEKFVFD